MEDFLTAHWLDIVTTVLGLAYILLEYRASLWMWVVGFSMQALGIVLYYQKGLYADCGMEFYYLSMTVYGYWKWVRGNHRDRSFDTSADSSDPQPPNLGGLEITHIPLRLLVRWSVIMAAVWALIYWLLVTYTNSNVPLADSFTTALSLIGIWALAHKYLEQWFIWIAVDVVTSILYFYKDIPFKASLYALYVIIAIFGYMKWRRMMTSDAK
ncbi:nicotinamide riboside transporter PnuC [uncultured Prevotella sp.]|uniref:nicotinamide riboside transporter PnuC n=1 Tax=uncultured Prevotella sp. TaxID=159272 RepID=UPI00258A9910|nr:nicotinamide riboside transporter PnuC [uncultured Prevotella sp.]